MVVTFRTGNVYRPDMIEGTVGALLFHAQCSNKYALWALIQKLEQQFKQKTGATLVGKEEFYFMLVEKNKTGSLTIQDMLVSSLFQSMQVNEHPFSDDKITKRIAIKMIESARRHFTYCLTQPDEEEMLVQWYTRFAGRVLSEEEISTYKQPDHLMAIKQLTAILEKRKELNREVYTAAKEGKLKQKDLQVVVTLLHQTVEKTKQSSPLTLELTGKYIQLMGKSKNPLSLATNSAKQLLVNANDIFSEPTQEVIKSGNTYYPNIINGTVGALLFHAQYDNEQTIRALVETLMHQFKEKTGAFPLGKEEFCSMVIEKNTQGVLKIEDMLASQLFQNMQSFTFSCKYDKTEELIALRMMEAARRYFNDFFVFSWEEKLLIEWYRRFAKRVLSEEQILAYVELEEETVLNEYKEINAELFTAVREKRLTREEFRVITTLFQEAVQTAQTYSSFLLELAGKYISLMGQTKNPECLALDSVKQLWIDTSDIFPSPKD